MDEFFKSAPKIIEEAAKNPFGLTALVILALSVLAFFFFRHATELTRIVIYVLTGLAILTLVAVVFVMAAIQSELSDFKETHSPQVSSPEHNVAEADDLLVQAANTINRQLPKMVDPTTRLDSTVAGPGKRFTYLLTIVTHRAADLDRTQLYGAMAPTLRNSECQRMEPFFKNGVTITYSYRGNDGAFVMEIPITPNDCGYR